MFPEYQGQCSLSSQYVFRISGQGSLSSQYVYRISGQGSLSTQYVYRISGQGSLSSQSVYRISDPGFYQFQNILQGFLVLNMYTGYSGRIATVTLTKYQGRLPDSHFCLKNTRVGFHQFTKKRAGYHVHKMFSEYHGMVPNFTKCLQNIQAGLPKFAICLGQSMGAGSLSSRYICLQIMKGGFHELAIALQREGLDTVEYGVPRFTIIFLSRSITENDASLGPGQGSPFRQFTIF